MVGLAQMDIIIQVLVVLHVQVLQTQHKHTVVLKVAQYHMVLGRGHLQIHVAVIVQVVLVEQVARLHVQDVAIGPEQQQIHAM